jgi:hypothetical protein
MIIAKPASASVRLNDERVQRTDLDQTAGERHENNRRVDRAPKALNLIAGDYGRTPQSNGGDHIVSTHPEGRENVRRDTAVETTDLERRVLVLDRILQALIAHMAETEPRFIDRLSATFTDPVHVAHQEQNYIDTASYAERFIREIVRLGEQPRGLRTRAPQNFQNQKQAERRLVAPPEISDSPALVFELRHRSGIWQVTKDGRFYGDFLSEKEALDSAEAAVRSVVANGGRATLSDAVIEL